jgi:hypothetical protein
MRRAYRMRAGADIIQGAMADPSSEKADRARAGSKAPYCRLQDGSRGQRYGRQSRRTAKPQGGQASGRPSLRAAKPLVDDRRAC